QGKPLVDANVALVRRASGASGGTTLEIVAQGQTDATGSFSLGVVAMDLSLAFPLETGVQFEYSVYQNATQMPVTSVSYVAPRTGGAAASINASIHVR